MCDNNNYIIVSLLFSLKKYFPLEKAQVILQVTKCRVFRL